MITSRSTITLPFDNRTQTYDRDKLATAVLVYLDALGEGVPSTSVTMQVSHHLRSEHGFATDAITYAIGARICHENDIDPYRGAEAVTAR